MTHIPRFASAAAVLAASILAVALAPRPAQAQAAKPLQVQETNVDGVTVELVEAVRKEGVLTVKMRYRNGGAQPVKVELMGDHRDADKYYVVAGSTKFLVLRDAQKVPLMSTLNAHGGLAADLKPAGGFLVWAKYPAPPAEAKKFNFHTAHTPPFEDVPITEAK
jgi:hypothetical protein